MVVKYTMEDSPTRYSDSTKNQTKNLGIQESYSNKHDNVCKDEGSDKIERDSNIDELSKRTNIKRKRSRSPLQEPSSSKYYIESSEESRTSNEKRNLESERNISRRSHIVQDEEYEHPSFSLDRYRRSHHGRSRSPPITKNLNERFSRSLPPGAKGKVIVILEFQSLILRAKKIYILAKDTEDYICNFL